MSRLCTICGHPQLDAINAAVWSDQPIRRIADRYQVSKQALQRHKQHLKALVVTVEERKITIADRLQKLVVSAIQSLEEAFQQEDYRIKIMAATAVEKYARLYLDANKNSDNDAPNAVRFIEERHPELRDEFFGYLAGK